MPDYTNTTNYPVFASKAAFMTAMHEQMEANCNDHNKIVEIMQRFSNTDTSTFADPTEDGLITGATP